MNEIFTAVRPLDMRWGLLVLALVTVGCGLRGDLAEAEKLLPREMARAKKNGWPMTAAEISPPQVVADDKNGAEIIAHLGHEDLQKVIGTYRTASLDAKRDKSQIDTRALREALDDASSALKIVDRAADAPAWWFKFDYDLGPYLVFSHLAQMKEGAKMLTDRAMLHALEGDMDGCLSDLRKVRRIALGLDRQPFLIAALVQIAISSIEQKAMVDIAAQVHRNPATLAKLASLAERKPVNVDLAHSLQGEFYMGLSLLRNFDAFGGLKAIQATMSPEDEAPKMPDASKLIRSGEPKDPLSRAYLTRHLQFWNEFAEARDEFDGDPVAMSEWLDAKAKQAEKNKSPSNTVTRILNPVFVQAGMACLQPLTTTRLTRAYISALQIKSRTGQYPQTLETEIDPFDDKPLRYKRTGDGFMIWSVSNDRKDNGGKRSDPEGGRDYVVEFKG
ncbi:MAG TPA: hypothetical protein PKA27_09860 [Fimbriimonadaceae bacterium]|nr:hypothetical protein [Fimbriimonadaceae bacterium]